MRHNVNHFNYFKKEKDVVEIVPTIPTKEPEVVVVSVEPSIDEDVIELTEEYLYALTKSEQVEFLLGLGLSNSEIKKLKHEKDRVDKILELQ